jgi:uncharacterized protein YkwD
MRFNRKSALIASFGHRALLCLSIVFLASCRLIITTDEGGYITSASGSSDCNQTQCIIEIEDQFEDTFTAVAAEGFRFLAWKGICEKKTVTEVCKLKLAPLTGPLSIHDDDVEIWAEFESTATARVWYRDGDSDNYGSANLSQLGTVRPSGFVANNLDCDDSNSSIFPGALELHDSVDNNCDDRIDEGFTATRYYIDQDGDDYGSSANSIDAFEPIDGYVENGSDCNDSNDMIFPGAQEAYDSVDNNCDGAIDEGFVLKQYYRDADNDNFGDASDSVQAVAAPSGYVSNGSDNCSAVYNPSQSDSDSDGIGNACDPVDDNSVSPGGCSMTAEEQTMLDAVNAARAQTRECGSKGTYPAASSLTWSCELEAASLGHSQDMANNNFFSHTGSDGKTSGYRATAAGYTWSRVGENIAAGIPYTAVSAVVQGWVNSPGHCANLMGSNFTQLGAAKFTNASSTYNVYWTQMFGTPR